LPLQAVVVRRSAPALPVRLALLAIGGCAMLVSMGEPGAAQSPEAVAAKAARSHGISERAFLASVCDVEPIESGARVWYVTGFARGYVDVTGNPAAPSWAD
jgi:hypothetical protein